MVTQGLRISGPNPAADAGEYAIKPYGASIPAGYTVQYVNGLHEIIPAPLQARVSDRETRYGQAPSFVVRYYGLRNGDTAPATVRALRVVPDGGPLYGDQVAANASTDAGSYDVYADVFDPNYEVLPLAGNWTVAKASLLIRLDSVTRTWGDPWSPYHTEVQGLVNGDTTSDVGKVRVDGPGGTPDIGIYQLMLSAAPAPTTRPATRPGACGWNVGT